MKNPRSPERRPWHPTLFSVDDVYAFQALQKGTANEVQQRRALDFLIRNLCGTYDATFMPDSDRETVFAEAKRHVGLEVVKLVNLPPAAIAALRAQETKKERPNE